MSQSRACNITKAVDLNWYLEIGDFEYANDPRDCTMYGPFSSQKVLESFLRKLPNPGSSETDDSGTAPVPKNVTKPTL